MTPDERLKEIWDELEEAILYGDTTVFNIDEFREQQQLIDELLASRQTIKRLVEDGERMVSKYKMLRNNCPDMLVEEARECISNTNAAILIQYLADMDNIIDQHIALMKDLEEKK